MGAELMPDRQRVVNVLIEGRVQGVGFRYWTEREARSLGLDGWVRNRRDGAVEALFSGAPQAVADMVALCGEGPSYAHVREVTILREGGSVAGGFKVKRTE